MDLQTAPAVHPPLLDSVTEETLRRNVAKVLKTLAENRYQDSPPAKLVAKPNSIENTINGSIAFLLKSPTKSSAVKKFTTISAIVACSPTASAL